MSGVVSGLIFGALIVVIWWIGSRRHSSVDEVAVDRPDLAYSVYTTDFDLEIDSIDINSQLLADHEEYVPPQGVYEADISERRTSYLASLENSRRALRKQETDLSGRAVCILLDLSGSMAGRIPWVLGELRAFAEWCRENNAQCSVLGYTTRGWRGGRPRQVWIGNGRPDYPGRLCAVMHITVESFEGNGGDADWEALLDPGFLRENVDGEALRWAASALAQIDAERRTLVVISDGAPVDDSTFSENGGNFLVRDIRDAIADIERAGTLELHGVGLSYRVDEYYSSAYYVAEQGGLMRELLATVEAGESN